MNSIINVSVRLFTLAEMLKVSSAAILMFSLSECVTTFKSGYTLDVHLFIFFFLGFSAFYQCLQICVCVFVYQCTVTTHWNVLSSWKMKCFALHLPVYQPTKSHRRIDCQIFNDTTHYVSCRGNKLRVHYNELIFLIVG